MAASEIMLCGTDIGKSDGFGDLAILKICIVRFHVFSVTIKLYLMQQLCNNVLFS